MHPRSPRSRNSSPWPNLLIGVAVGFLLSTIFSSDRTEESINERLLRATNQALAPRKQIASVTEFGGNSHETENGWHTIDVYYGKRQHLPLYSAINTDYFHAGVRWFSQRRQDLVVSTLLKGKKNGYFVDLAANDAVQISNTYALETYFDWNGLCIEPNPQYWMGLAFRKCQIAATVIGQNNQEEIQFRYSKKAQRGGIVDEKFENQPGARADHDIDLARYAMRLEDIFERYRTPPVIDYMSLDIEGAEYYAMHTFPFDRYRFNILTVEGCTDNLASLLEQNGYKLLKVMLKNKEFLWIHKDVESELDLNALDIDTERYNYRERIDKVGQELIM